MASSGAGLCPALVWLCSLMPACADAVDARGDSSPVEADSSPVEADSSPVEADSSPVEADSSPVEADSSPVEADSSPVEADSSPVEADSSPVEADSTPVTSDTADPGPTRYVAGAIHSSLTPAVAKSLLAIAARAPAARDDVFMKVGDSITAARSFMVCLADAAVDLQGRADLADTRALFAGADDLEPDGGGPATTPFDRVSLAAVSGRTAAWVMTAPADGEAPVALERAAISPRFAVVMFGTNDIGYWPDDFPRMFRWYGEHMWDLVEQLVGDGVVPILSSVPPRLDSPTVLDARVATMNALIRGLAERYQVPFVDFHLALAATSDWGMAGDGVHPRQKCDDGGVRCGCRFDASGLEAGYNIRNWITLEALDRTRRVVAGEDAPDAPARAPLAGRGTAADPFVIDALPFTDYRDAGLDDAIDRYSGCDAPQDESGPEVYYRLELAASTPIAALVIDRARVDVDIHILRDTNNPADCRVRADTFIEDTLAAGTWWFVVDTFVNQGGTAFPGAYLFTLNAR